MKNFLSLVPSLLVTAGLFAAGFTVLPSDFRDAPRALDALPGEAAAAPDASAPAAADRDSLGVWAGGSALVNKPTEMQKTRMAQSNRGLKQAESAKALQLELAVPVFRPFADYERTGYLIMNGNFEFNSLAAKRAAASTLGPEGTLVLMVSPRNEPYKADLIRQYSDIVPAARIKVVAVRDADRGFWARDAVPVPMISLADGSLTVIDARYYHNFNSDAEIAQMFGAKLESTGYFYEGGNYMANDRGDCLMVNAGQHVEIPDHVFTRYYGCKKLVRLPLEDGIGHIDEHARFVSADTVLTDLPSYKQILEREGFRVVMLPKVPADYATHVNSLIIDGKVAVPVYGRGTDAEALRVYESVGLKAIPADSYTLSTRGLGSVHCITMTYPPAPFKAVLKALDAREL